MVFIGLVLLFGCLMIGVPVPFAFLTSTMFFIFTGDYESTFMLPYGISKISTSVLFAIPLFVIAGGVMEKGNIADKLVGLADGFATKLKGGLGVVGVVSCAIFGSVTGSACATLTCVGSIMFPRFEKAGYGKGYSAALMANSAVLGLLIPPSAIMILYAWVGGQSVLASFLATVVPGIMLTTLFSLINCYILKDDPNISLDKIAEAQGQKLSFFGKTKQSFPALLMPVIVLGGIYSGIMTPTEAAAVAVVYAIPVGMFLYRSITLKGLGDTLIDAATSTGSIMIMLFCCMILSRIYVMEDMPGRVLELLYSVSTNKYAILLMLNVFMVVMGMLMDDASACMLATPILIPIIQEIGVSPVHFAAIVGVNLGMGNITPPCAPLLYLSSSIGKASISDMLSPTFKFILFGWLPVLMLTTYLPGLSMWLPRLILGIK